MNRPVLVVYDLDGTLIDSRNEISEAINLTRQAFGLIPAELNALNSWFGSHPGQFFSEITNPKELENAINEFRHQLRFISDGKVKTFIEALPVLARIHHSGITQAIATTKPTALAEELLHGSPILDYVSIIQGTDNFMPKPNPELFFQLERRLGLPKYFRRISIGDRVEDALAGSAAGYESLAVRRNSWDPSEYAYQEAGARVVMNNLTGILKWLEN
jgi:phosphoglycolate phosphatase-like HAD superfamily hydrolase